MIMLFWRWIYLQQTHYDKLFLPRPAIYKGQVEDDINLMEVWKQQDWRQCISFWISNQEGNILNSFLELCLSEL